MMTAPDNQAVLRENRRLNEALVNADRDALESLLAPGFVATHITGRQQTRDDWIDQIAAGRMQYHRIDEESAVVRIDGDNAVLTTRDRVDATMWDLRSTWPLESVTTYTRTGDGWRAAHSTATTY